MSGGAAAPGRVMTGGPAASGRVRGRARHLGRELVVFGLVGGASTVIHLGGFAALRPVLDSAQLANALALLVAAALNTWANRRWTFGVRGRDGAARHQVQGLLVFLLTLGMTASGLDLVHALVANPPTWVETMVVAATTIAATVVKFAAMKVWVFRADHQDGEAAGLSSGHPRSSDPVPAAGQMAARPRMPGQSSSSTKAPSSSSKKTTPVHSKPSTLPVQTTAVDAETDAVSGQLIRSWR
ncbi:MAG: GtrA family protein [Dermatophilaceae bacterium]